jgi:hypothetical protein
MCVQREGVVTSAPAHPILQREPGHAAQQERRDQQTPRREGWSRCCCTRTSPYLSGEVAAHQRVGAGGVAADAVGAEADEQRQSKKKRKKKIVPHVIVHDFRRTAIRELARAGVSEARSMELCGHVTRSVFDRYDITTKDDLREAVARLNAAKRATIKVSSKVVPFSGGSASANVAK